MESSFCASPLNNNDDLRELALPAGLPADDSRRATSAAATASAYACGARGGRRWRGASVAPTLRGLARGPRQTAANPGPRARSTPIRRPALGDRGALFSDGCHLHAHLGPLVASLPGMGERFATCFARVRPAVSRTAPRPVPKGPLQGPVPVLIVRVLVRV